MHGVQPKAKAMPMSGGAKTPSDSGSTWNRRSRCMAPGTRTPAMNSPMTIVRMPAAWLRPCWWRSRVWPMALAPAPRIVKTIVKPATNSSVARNSRRVSSPVAAESCVTLTPDISDR
jgi:hypothetical protein